MTTKPNRFASLPTIEARDRAERIREELEGKTAKAGKRSAYSAKAAKPAKRAKERMTFHIAPEVADRLRRAVYWTPGLTITELAEGALAAEVERLEKRAGKAFAPIPAGKAIPAGRPPGPRS